MSFVVMSLLTVSLTGLLKAGLGEHVALLEAHGRAMVDGPIGRDAPYSIANIEARAQRLQVLVYAVLAGGFLVLYASLRAVEHRRTRRELRGQQQFYERILDVIPVSIAVFDREHRYVYCNPSAVGNGDVREWIIGKDDFEYCAHRGFDRSIAANRRQYFETAVEERGPQSWEETLPNLEGAREHHLRHLSPVSTRSGELEMVLGYSVDITERKEAQRALERAHGELEDRVEERTMELHELNRRLQHDAFHDALTGLPNRALFVDRLGHAIQRWQRRTDAGFAVLFMDLDRFKVVNDSLGHAAGDELLRGAGERLAACLRPGDTVARFGGDEFTMLLENLDEIAEATRVAQRILNEMMRPFDVCGQELHVSVSIGIISHAAGYDCPQDTLRDADVAMYRAKVHGKGRYQVFEPAMREQARNAMKLENDLRRALDRGDLHVHYQPIMSVQASHLRGFEALARWTHPEYGNVTPGEFVPIAEDAGLIVELDHWVLREACHQAGAWRQEFTARDLTLNVNFSSQHFTHDDFPDRVAATLAETGFEPHRLNIELTETALLNDSIAVKAGLRRLAALGVRLQIDDFGTGYSSLSYLQQFPVHGLKIDRAFIDALDVGGASEALVRTIIDMARGLDLGVVAEGVETATQLAVLGRLGCIDVQGFFFSKPLPADEAGHLLHAGAEADEAITELCAPG